LLRILQREKKRLYAVSCGTQRSHFFMAGANG
jgi:hypothetical protein